MRSITKLRIYTYIAMIPLMDDRHNKSLAQALSALYSTFSLACLEPVIHLKIAR
uniref:Uncharacterized protein n=1 Tax=Utricularia reniformis TaxID=192314 RepID=A0A1Y0B4T5_9LAMI|nr:hypothetical protein AEK19_MT2252 [Utricularia reniformis]ART32397.1 hypothetical protein AEK19_MT2252 [Utricularia reniformis]